MKLKQLVLQLLSSNSEAIEKIKIRRKLNNYAKTKGIKGLYEEIHSQYSPVFVLSTGRCGTAYLTNLVALNKDIKAYHEPSPEFFHHTEVAFEDHKINSEKVAAIFDVARYELIRDTFIDEKVYFETNNRVTFFANQILELYPKAKFIHLIRNPKSFIKSGLGRNWYSGNNLYDEGRLCKKSLEWNNFSSIQKIAWLWDETNGFIDEFKSKLNPNQILTVKSEELFKSLSIQKSIFEFMNKEAPSENRLNRLMKHRVNEGVKMELSNLQNEEIDIELTKLRLKSKYYA